MQARWEEIQVVDIESHREVCVLERVASIGWEVPGVSDVIVLNEKERWEIVSREFHPERRAWVLGAVRA